jgi:hypothetical protein
MKCRVGDLAVVIAAHHRSNLGRIVRILAQHDGSGSISFTGVGHVWLVDAPQSMVWSVGTKRYRRKIGPVPDCQLQPIREQALDEALVKFLSKARSKQKKELKRVEIGVLEQVIE